jgi:catechol 2,3-dioxygenase-like lactoylglutathione lyase family enzyme
MRRLLLAASLLAAPLAACKRAPPSPLLAAARACHEEGDPSCARPILNVRNLRESQRHYRDALGFEIDWEHGEPPDFGSVSRGGLVIFMCENCQGTPGAWVMSFTKDVDALHRELVGKQARIRMPPTTMPWGLRELHVSDPDGNVLRFASAGER